MYNANTSLCSWLSYIERIYPICTHFSLSRIMIVAKKLGLLKSSSFIFTVSGTNGKSSTCYMLERILLNAGYKVGLYTSPHLINYYERIRINGKYIIDDIIHTTIFYSIELARKDILLTYFEFITLSALLIFKQQYLDIIILEVGIGGRLDATNILDPNIAIITNIELDHMHLLGYTRNSIASEKSGIFRKGIDIIIGTKNIPNIIYKISSRLHVRLNRLLYEWNWVKIRDYWNFYDKFGGLYQLPIPKLSLSSVATAVSALRVSQYVICHKLFQQSINQVFLPGRFHIIVNNPQIIVDVAHNPHASNYLYYQLKQLILFKKEKNFQIYSIIGMVSDKDIMNTILPLLNIVNLWFYVPLKTYRSININYLKSCLPNESILCNDVAHAFHKIFKIVQSIDIILVFGSFFLVSEVILFIKNKYNIQNIIPKN
ncbi:bifunctional tetrahydrofolate synthase/dihydrofolate synthase [Buchnera aphidicola (Stegophylla sp.)]|uniref:Dihydrofolate synthase/folylpolyglutamate synthase n=2 Tax=Buchnera aphidicola TaxID=9 RepID=A0A4D6YNB8_9GAMM|nr:bifunctional tetrahydrofolate synthase/dihydrofolate synthase [Buchnera aphidicola (Stegophylla sp.)]